MFARHRRDQRIAELSEVELFDGCSAHQLEAISGLADEVEFPAGATLMEKGRTGRECFIVLDGEADVRIRGKRVATIGAGDITGEMALIEHEPRSATVEAKTPLRALVLTQRSLDAMLGSAPAVTFHVLRALAERLRAVQAA